MNTHKIQIVLDCSPNGLLEWKRQMLGRLFGNREIYSDPERWFDLAKLIGQLKSEINPELEYRWNSPPDTMDFSKTEEERQKILAEHNRRWAMGNYQVSLDYAINSLTRTLISRAYYAEFDDDAKRDDEAKRKEYKKNLVRLAQLSEEDTEKLDVSKRIWYNPEPPTEDTAKSSN